MTVCQPKGLLTVAGIASYPSELHYTARACDTLGQDEAGENIARCLVGCREVVVALACIRNACRHGADKMM